MRSSNQNGRGRAWVGIVVASLLCVGWIALFIVVGAAEKEKEAQRAAQAQQAVATANALEAKAKARAPEKVEEGRKALAASDAAGVASVVRWLRSNNQHVPDDLGESHAHDELARAGKLYADRKLEDALAAARGAIGFAGKRDPELKALVQKIEAEPVIDATAILGQSRAKAHGVLGKPIESDPDSNGQPFDKFTVRGAKVLVQYFGGRVRRLFVGTSIPRGKLNLPPGDTFKLAGTEYAVAKVGDQMLFSDVAFDKAEEKRGVAAAAAAERSLRASLEKKTRTVRTEAAEQMEYNMLKAGMEARVRALGANGTVLNIEWAGCDRSTLVQIWEGGSWGVSGGDKIRALGFKKVQCADSYGGVASMSVE